MDYEDRDIDDNDYYRKMEAYHAYELDIATMKGDKPTFGEWVEMVNNDNDRYETEQSALANTR